MSKKNEISIVDYREILNTVELDNICLIDGSFKLIKEKLSNHIKIEIKDSSTYEIKDQTLIIKYKTILKGISEETSDVSIVASSIHEMVYSFSGDKEITPEFMDKFSTYSASVVIWPYFREYVQNMVSRSQMTPLTLPLKKIV